MYRTIHRSLLWFACVAVFTVSIRIKEKGTGTTVGSSKMEGVAVQAAYEVAVETGEKTVACTVSRTLASTGRRFYLRFSPPDLLKNERQPECRDNFHANDNFSPVAGQGDGSTLVMLFHGFKMKSSTILSTSMGTQWAKKLNFVVVAPTGKEGYSRSSKSGLATQWDIINPTLTAGTLTDAAFVSTIIQREKSVLYTTRIYGVGYSLGGGFTSSLLCALVAPSAFTAFALFNSRTGGFGWTVESGYQYFDKCNPSSTQVVPLMQHNNIQDTLTRLAGKDRHGTPGGGALDRWFSISNAEMGCANQSLEEIYECKQFKDCSALNGPAKSAHCTYDGNHGMVDPRWLGRTVTYLRTGKIEDLACPDPYASVTSSTSGSITCSTYELAKILFIGSEKVNKIKKSKDDGVLKGSDGLALAYNTVNKISDFANSAMQKHAIGIIRDSWNYARDVEAQLGSA